MHCLLYAEHSSEWRVLKLSIRISGCCEHLYTFVHGNGRIQDFGHDCNGHSVKMPRKLMRHPRAAVSRLHVGSTRCLDCCLPKIHLTQ
jgi:hypothetical protein